MTRARAAGVGAFLSKPVTQSELLNAVLSVLSPSAEAALDLAPAPVRPEPRGARLLVAEDNVVNQRVAAGLLERRGHRAVVVGTGRAALAALQSQPFDVVLMDIEMPELDGFEATAAVRALEHDIRRGLRAAPAGSAYAVARASEQRIPILALTAHAMKGMEDRCLAARMDGYVSKPLTMEALDAALALFLPGAPGGTGSSARSVIDRGVELKAVGGDATLLTDLVRMFLEDGPARVAELREAVGGGDAGRLERSTHAVKGAVATFGARIARELAADLERAAREHRLGEAPALLGELEAELDRVSRALRREFSPADDTVAASVDSAR